MSRAVMANCMCLMGLSLVLYAAWLAWPPMAFALAGVLLCGFGVFANRLSSGGSR